MRIDFTISDVRSPCDSMTQAKVIAYSAFRSDADLFIESIIVERIEVPDLHGVRTAAVPGTSRIIGTAYVDELR